MRNFTEMEQIYELIMYGAFRALRDLISGGKINLVFYETVNFLKNLQQNNRPRHFGFKNIKTLFSYQMCFKYFKA